MKFQRNYLILILNILLVKGENILTNEFTELQIQLFSDVFDIKERLEHLRTSVDILNKRHLQQLNGLKDVIATCHTNAKGFGTSHYSDEVCEEIMFYSNETLSKYAQFNNKLVTNLEESHRNQSQHLDTILNKRVLQKECQTQSAQLTTTSTKTLLSQIDTRIDSLAHNLNHFEFLEEKLALQQKKSQELYDKQIQILTEIKKKLLKNEEKFVKYQRELPDVNNFSNKISNLANWRHWRHRHMPRQ